MRQYIISSPAIQDLQAIIDYFSKTRIVPSTFIIMQQFNIQNALTRDRHFEQADFIRLLN